MDIIKSPQENISAYLYNAINIEIYEEYGGRKDVLDFFNFLYSEFAFFNDNIENYLTINSHFKNYDNNLDYYEVKNDEILNANLAFHYQTLAKLIKEKYPLKQREGVILKSCEYIESISDVINRMLYRDVNMMNDILEDIKDLDYGEKIKYLIEIKYISLQNEALFVDKKDVTIASKIDLEIDRLGQLRKLEIEARKTETPLLDDIFFNNGFEFKNNFDNVNEMTVFNYFKTNLVDRKHLSETDLNLFLNLAFDKMEVPTQKFSFEHLNTQQGIIKYFYNYYKVVAGKPHGKQPNYLNLLCNYFNGFDYDKIKTNFAK